MSGWGDKTMTIVALRILVDEVEIRVEDSLISDMLLIFNLVACS